MNSSTRNTFPLTFHLINMKIFLSQLASWTIKVTESTWTRWRTRCRSLCQFCQIFRFGLEVLTLNLTNLLITFTAKNVCCSWLTLYAPFSIPNSMRRWFLSVGASTMDDHSKVGLLNRISISLLRNNISIHLFIFDFHWQINKKKIISVCLCRFRRPKAHRLPHHIAWASARYRWPITRPISTKYSRSCWLSRALARWSRENSPLAKWSVSLLNWRVELKIKS